MADTSHWPVLDLLRDPSRNMWSTTMWDVAMIWKVLQGLTCPPPCAGVVNQTGWHQECQKRAQEAMKALGFTPPNIDPIPASSGHDDFAHLYEESFRMPSWVYDHPDVCTSPWRMGGHPCVRGTRVPVGIIFNLMDGPDGITDEEIAYFYPHVPASQITRLRAAREEHNNV